MTHAALITCPPLVTMRHSRDRAAPVPLGAHPLCVRCCGSQARFRSPEVTEGTTWPPEPEGRRRARPCPGRASPQQTSWHTLPSGLPQAARLHQDASHLLGLQRVSAEPEQVPLPCCWEPLLGVPPLRPPLPGAEDDLQPHVPATARGFCCVSSLRTTPSLGLLIAPGARLPQRLTSIRLLPQITRRFSAGNSGDPEQTRYPRTSLAFCGLVFGANAAGYIPS